MLKKILCIFFIFFTYKRTNKTSNILKLACFYIDYAFAHETIPKIVILWGHLSATLVCFANHFPLCSHTLSFSYLHAPCILYPCQGKITFNFTHTKIAVWLVLWTQNPWMLFLTLECEFTNWETEMLFYSKVLIRSKHHLLHMEKLRKSTSTRSWLDVKC